MDRRSKSKENNRTENIINVSSARERRRRSKQEGGRGRVVLKSRSAADACKIRDKKEATPPGGRREENSDHHTLIKKTDVALIDKDKELMPDNAATKPECDIGEDEPDCDQIMNPSQVEGEREKDNERASEDKQILHTELDRVSQAEEKEEKQRPSCKMESESASLNGHSSDEVEVEEFCNLLDTTLHLVDSPTPFENDDHPGPPCIAFSTEGQLCGDVIDQRLPPGRLSDRIKALRE